MRLRSSHLNEPGLRRVRCGKGFRYLGPDGHGVDQPTLERIQGLVLPPAWQDVWICPHPNGHIQAMGIDAAGRRQYRYHESWRMRRDQEKFVRMIEFARCLPSLRMKLAVDLHQAGLPKTRVLALGIRLLDVGMFRVGGEEYAEEHETYGLATIEKRHLQIRNNQACFDYPAKGGKRRQITIDDPLIVELLAQLKSRRGGGSGLLAWREERRWIDVSSHDLNTYLKQQSEGDFTAKDFRTWDASLLAAVLCAQAPSTRSPSANKRCIAKIVREVADSLGNTPAVCRKSYIDPRILDHFECNDTIAPALGALKRPFAVDDTRSLCEIEQALIALLTSEDMHVAIAS